MGSSIRAILFVLACLLISCIEARVQDEPFRQWTPSFHAVVSDASSFGFVYPALWDSLPVSRGSLRGIASISSVEAMVWSGNRIYRLARNWQGEGLRAMQWEEMTIISHVCGSLDQGAIDLISTGDSEYKSSYRLFLGAPNGVCTCLVRSDEWSCRFVDSTSFSWGNVSSISGAVLNGEVNIFATTNAGLFRVIQSSPVDKIHRIPSVECGVALGFPRCIRVKVGPFGIASSTEMALYTTRDASKALEKDVWRHEWVGGVVDQPIETISYARVPWGSSSDPSVHPPFTRHCLLGGNSWSVAVQEQSPTYMMGAGEFESENFMMTRFGGVDGLPAAQIISSDVSVDPWNKLGDLVVLGHNSRNLESMCTASPMHPVRTSFGGVSLWIPSLLSKSGECSQRHALASGGCFLYMQGQRWIVDDSVMQVSMDIVRSPDDEIGFWVLSEMGISRIESRRLRLSDKASLFQGRVRPCSWRLNGLVSPSSLSSYGDESSCTPHPNENDGLWTSLYVATQSFRFAALQRMQRHEEAQEAFSEAVDSVQALQTLIRVTGVDGLMARSLCAPKDAASCVTSGGSWMNSTKMPGYVFMYDASSDEIVGHMFGYSVFSHLVGDVPSAFLPSQRASFYSVAKYIADNGFTLVDVTGKPTRWGRWDPASMNGDPTWYSERGLNAIQLLSYLALAEQICPDGSCIDPRKKSSFPPLSSLVPELALRDQYFLNALNARVTMPTDIDASDDELMYLSYYIFSIVNASSLWSDASVSSPGFAEKWNTVLRSSMFRAFEPIRSQGYSLFNFLQYLISPNSVPEFSIDDALVELRRWPLSGIDWGTDNSCRRDYQLSPYLYRESSLASTTSTTFSRDSTPCQWWNCSKRVLSGGSGRTLYPPSNFLLPYWIAVYADVLTL